MSHLYTSYLSIALFFLNAIKQLQLYHNKNVVTCS